MKQSDAAARLRLHSMVLALSAVLALGSSARGQFADPAHAPLPVPSEKVELSKDRWSEQSHGVSLAPPKDVTISPPRRGGPLATFTRPGAYAISVYIKETADPATLEELARRVSLQVASPYPSAIMLPDDSKTINVGEHPVAQLYFKIPDDKRGTWYMGLSIFQVNPHTVVLIRLDVDELNYQEVRPTYEAVVRSMQIASPEELDARRREQIERGIKWRESLTPVMLEKAFAQEAWFRVVSDNKDVGYMRMRSYRDTEFDSPGIRFDIDVRVKSERNTIDTESRFFLSDDNIREFWSIKTAVRTPMRTTTQRRGARANDDNVAMSLWTETGLRSDSEVAPGSFINVVSIDRKTPSGVEKYEWDTPAVGYLSQVEVQLLGSLLPHDKPEVFGFYAYSPANTAIGYRTDRVEPQLDGTYIVHSRLTPTSPEQVTVYDANGKMLKRTLPDGLELHAASTAEIKARWNVR